MRACRTNTRGVAAAICDLRERPLSFKVVAGDLICQQPAVGLHKRVTDVGRMVFISESNACDLGSKLQIQQAATSGMTVVNRVPYVTGPAALQALADNLLMQQRSSKCRKCFDKLT